MTDTTLEDPRDVEIASLKARLAEITIDRASLLETLNQILARLDAVIVTFEG
jgi:hypothetical protein